MTAAALLARIDSAIRAELMVAGGAPLGGPAGRTHATLLRALRVAVEALQAQPCQCVSASGIDVPAGGDALPYGRCARCYALAEIARLLEVTT